MSNPHALVEIANKRVAVVRICPSQPHNVKELAGMFGHSKLPFAVVLHAPHAVFGDSVQQKKLDLTGLSGGNQAFDCGASCLYC